MGRSEPAGGTLPLVCGVPVSSSTPGTTRSCAGKRSGWSQQQPVVPWVQVSWELLFGVRTESSPKPGPCFALPVGSAPFYGILQRESRQAGQKQQPQTKAQSPRLHHASAGSGCGWQGCSRRLRRCLMSRGVGRNAAACSTGRARLCFLAPARSLFPFKHFQPGSICFLLPSAPVPVQFVDQSRTRWPTLKRFQNTGGTRPPRELAAKMTRLGAERRLGWALDDAGPQ